MIGSYKSAVAKNVKAINPEFKWQTRFYDHIIRDQIEYDRISYYICYNPEQWNKDKFNQ